MTKWITVSLTILAVTVMTGPAPAQSRIEQPHQVIETASAEFLEAIDGRRDYLAEHPDELHGVVDSVLRSRFDTEYAARLILARHWSGATAEQREEFIEALYGSLLRRYASGLLEHTETTVRVTPPRLDFKTPEEDFETVRTFVILDDGREVPVHYEMRLADNVWKAFDVKIEGRSYVAYYRDTIGEDIKMLGFAGVVDKLNER